MVPYAESVNIPLIIHWPGALEAGTVSDELFTPMDHLPTLCGLIGLEPPDTVDGIDLSASMRGNGSSGRDAVLMMTCSSHWDFFQTQTNWPEWRGVQTKRYTYCKWLSGEEELYDNQQDPCQMHDLAAEDDASPVLVELRGELQRLLAEAHDEFLPGTAYGDWVDDERNIVRTGLGPVR